MPTSPDQSDFLKGFIDSLGTAKPEYLFYLTKALGYSPTCECAGCGGSKGTYGLASACQHGYINDPFPSVPLEGLKPSVPAYWDEDVLTVNVFGLAPHFGLDGVLIRIYAYPMGDGLNDWIPGELLPEYDVTYSNGDPLAPYDISRKGVQYVPGISIGEIPHNKQYFDTGGMDGFLPKSFTHGFTGAISIPEEILTKPRQHFTNKLAIHAAVIYPERVMYSSETSYLATLGMVLCGSLVIDIPEKPIVITPPTISCEGATDNAYFFNTPSNMYEFWVDGVFAFNSNGFPFSIPSPWDTVFSTGGDGDWIIANLDSVEHRIELKSEYPEELPTIERDSSDSWLDVPPNPTISIDPNSGSVSFCLAPAGITP